jgi:hypothetical protein
VSATLYGLLAEFHAPEEIVKAAEGVHAAGYRKVDAYTPYPMEEVLDALHLHETHVPKLALAGGLLGMAGGWALQYWTQVIAYPMNIGGRPSTPGRRSWCRRSRPRSSAPRSARCSGCCC